MTLDEVIKRYTNNAEYERIHGSLQGCFDFRQLAEWLTDYKRLLEQEPTAKDDSCSECMKFSHTFDEFANEYGFKDKEEVYTNGSELIPVFRVKQWLEHIQEPTTKNNLAVDCVSRQVAIDALSKWLHEVFGIKESDGTATIFKRLRELPSVSPARPKGNVHESEKDADCISRQAVIDAIADIQLEIEDTGAYEQEVNGKTEFLKGIDYCLSIIKQEIDKYKAESEEEE